MLKGDFELIISSSPDREKVTCEIYYENELIAEISQETDNLLLEIYPPQSNKWWQLPFTEFQEALQEARKYLTSL